MAALAPGNPNAVALHHARPRERPRGARADLERDVGGINRLFLARRPRDRRAAARGPHEFFEELRDGAHRFQGTADATMTHGEPYEFLQLGLHLERAATTVRVVASLPDRRRARRGRPARAPELIALLESCSAFEAYPPARSVVRAAPDRRGADPLVRLPARRAVLPRTCATVRRRIASVRDAAPHPRAAVAELEYGEVDDVSGEAVAATLARAADGHQPGGRRGHEGVLLDRALPAAALAMQEAQQQQCG